MSLGQITYSIPTLEWEVFLMAYNIHNDGEDQITNTEGEFQSDGRDIEFSQELADKDDLTAQARSKAADQRAKARENNNNH